MHSWFCAYVKFVFGPSDNIWGHLKEERCMYFLSWFQSVVFGLLGSVPVGQSSGYPVSSPEPPSKHGPGDQALSMSLQKTFHVQTIRKTKLLSHKSDHLTAYL